MRLAILIAATAALQCTTANAMSVNVSMPGAVNPFTGYHMTYKDKDGQSCTFRFNQAADGLSYLTSDTQCPSSVTEDRVFMDAQRALKRMETVSTAQTFSEYFGEGPNGQKMERAKLRYRCMQDESISGYFFSPDGEPMHEGWYQLYYYPNGYKPHMRRIGIWQKQNNGTYVVDTGGGPLTIDASKVFDCNRH